ncbi:MAG: hypothetical protein JST19_11655 [Bacteroidetes bacterium]|nr:hypothetical protein [Bacteroidota bacterium]
MKPLKTLNNSQKAKLLHELFPDEMPAVVDFLKGYSEAFKEHEDMNRRAWKNPLFSFDFWLTLVNWTDTILTNNGKRITNSASLFADQLFDGHTAMYVTDCLKTYITIRRHPNTKFVHAVNMLFA